MIGLTAAMERCEQQRRRVRLARDRVHRWQMQTQVAARRAATSPFALLSAAIAGWWLGKRPSTRRMLANSRAGFRWRQLRQTGLRAFRLWAFWRGVQAEFSGVTGATSPT